MPPTQQAPAQPPEQKALPEPTFTLRARDHGTDEALIHYHRIAKDTGATPEYLAELEKAITAFREFPVDVPAGREPEGSQPGSSVAAAAAAAAKATEMAAKVTTAGGEKNS